MSEAHTADLGTRYRYRQEGAENERERIIKLLEEHTPQPNDHDFVGCESDECPVNQWFHIHLIELIKGEQK